MEDQKPVENMDGEKPVEIASFEDKNSVSPNKSTKKRINPKLFILGVLVLLIFIGAISAFLVFRNSKIEKINRARNDVFQKLKQGDYASAKEVAKGGLNISGDPYLIRSYIDASSALGNSTGTEKEEFKITEKLTKDLLKVDGENFESLLTVGYAFETAGKYEEALSYYEKAIALNPKSAQAYFHKGHVLAFLNRNAESRESYDKAYALDDTNPIVKLAKANMYQSEKKMEEALKLYIEVATDINAGKEIRTDAYTATAYLKSQLGQFQQSKEYAKEALKLDSKASLASGLYGFNSCLLGEYSDGLPALNEALKLNPRISLNYMFMGVVLRHIKNFPLAIKFQTDGISRISEDNTLVGEQEMKSMTAKMYYELAQTYSLIPDEEKAIENIYKTMSFVDYRIQLRKDLQNGNYFAKIRNSRNLNKFIN